MKNFIKNISVLLLCVLAFTCSKDDNNNSDEANQSLILGSWILTDIDSNDSEAYFESEGCDLILTFNETTLTSTEYYGNNPGECNLSDSYTSSYYIKNGTLYETDEGETYSYKIELLTKTELKLREDYDGYYYIYILAKQ